MGKGKGDEPDRICKISYMQAESVLDILLSS